MSNDTAPYNASATPLHGSDLARHILRESLQAHRQREQAHAEALAIEADLEARENTQRTEAIRQALDAEQLAIREAQ